jgi:formate dehydrogenase iron-sulfur subunit
MESLDRREFLKISGAGLGSFLLQFPEESISSSDASEDCMGMLFDATSCLGCKQCQVACREQRSSVDAGVDAKDVDTSPDDLSADAWTIIKLYEDEEDKSIYSFVKVQCMHCVDPACVTACPVGALQKTESGPVIYDSDLCIGCRYCMAACPFDVPKYEWEKVFPLIKKCDFCADRQEAGLEPACAEACANDVLKFGKRSELIEEAKARIEENPDRYVDHIYGEHEAGGTSKLYLSRVPFDKLGFPDLEDTSLPDLTWPWMSAIPGVVLGVGGLMGGVYWVSKRRVAKEEEEGRDDITNRTEE